MRRRIPTWLRLYVLHRDDHKCAYCRRPAQCLDHVIPVRLSGPNEPYNLVACCNGCNSDKGPGTAEIWLRQAFWHLVDLGEDLAPIVQEWEGTRVGEWAREA